MLPGDVSPSPPLQQQLSFKTEEVTGTNQIVAEFIRGVAGHFVMQDYKTTDSALRNVAVAQLCVSALYKVGLGGYGKTSDKN